MLLIYHSALLYYHFNFNSRYLVAVAHYLKLRIFQDSLLGQGTSELAQLEVFHFLQQGHGFHCSHQRGWRRIQREDRGGPKQANRIVSSSRSSWSGSQ